MNKFLGSLLVIGIFCFVTPLTLAETQTISVSPTLFNVNAAPGQTWQSELRIINVNDYPITVYAEPVLFSPSGEDGRGEFTSLAQLEDTAATLPRWITITTEGITIEPQQTASVPFTVTVPDDAPPGGHYAALLVGTRPPQTTNAPAQVQTAQFVTSLLFLRVAGEVQEIGTIREFTAENRITETAKNNFLLRFQNQGNVHLQPQGEIRITNMWGEERGIIPINHQTQFGNVLPTSIRQFQFSWSSEQSFFDIGRYKAEATVGFGDTNKQFVSAPAYFWVIPYQTILVTLLVLFVVTKLALWLIRRYIERTLELAGVDPREYRRQKIRTPGTVVVRPLQYSAPVVAEVSWLARAWTEAKRQHSRVRFIKTFVWRYRFVWIGLLVTLSTLAGIILMYRHVTADRASFTGTITTSGVDQTTNSELQIYTSERAQTKTPLVDTTKPAVSVINVSGRVGLGATARIFVEDAQYSVPNLEVDLTREETRTSIVYEAGAEAAAQTLSQLLGNVLVSQAPSDQKLPTPLVLYVGSDFNQIK